MESTKSVADIYAPVSGTVVAVNDALADTPELINSGPYEDGWMLEVQAPDGVPADLLDAAAYRELTGRLTGTRRGLSGHGRLASHRTAPHAPPHHDDVGDPR